MFNGFNHYHEHLCSFGLSIAHQPNATPHSSYVGRSWVKSGFVISKNLGTCSRPTLGRD